MVRLVIFPLREALHEVERSSTYHNELQQLATPLHSVSPSSNFSRNFTAVSTRAHTHTSRFSFRGPLQDKLLRKLHSVTGHSHPTSTTCSATFSNIARQVAEKIAQCNRAFKKICNCDRCRRETYHRQVSLWQIESVMQIGHMSFSIL